MSPQLWCDLDNSPLSFNVGAPFLYQDIINLVFEFSIQIVEFK